MKHSQATGLLLLALAVPGVPAAAQTSPASPQTKIGLINVERILRESPIAKRIQAKLQEEFAARDQELTKMAEQTKSMRARLEKDALTMPGEERQRLEREFDDASRTLMRRQREFNEEIGKRREQDLTGLFDRITRAAKMLAEQEKFDIVVKEAAWGSSRVDITDKVSRAIEAGEAGEASAGRTR